MLVLTRRIGEQIAIDGVISITVVSIEGGKALLGVDAPSSIRVDRLDVHERRGQATVSAGIRSVGRAQHDDPWQEDGGEA